MPEGAVTVFSFYTYIFAALTLFLVFLFFRLRSPKEERTHEPMPRRVLLFVLFMSLTLILTSYFKTLAAGFLPSAQLYPLNQGATLILSTAMAAVFFGEKPNAKCIAGILCAFVGLIVMNV